jgi:hypothetical protein
MTDNGRVKREERKRTNCPPFCKIKKGVGGEKENQLMLQKVNVKDKRSRVKKKTKATERRGTKERGEEEERIFRNEAQNER